MQALLFKNPQFKEGTNVTVRRGVKWNIITEPSNPIYDADTNVMFGYAVNTRSYVISFQDLKASDLVNEHDERCRTPLGLLQVMQEVYPGFRDTEIVTVLEFEVSRA